MKVEFSFRKQEYLSSIQFGRIVPCFQEDQFVPLEGMFLARNAKGRMRWVTPFFLLNAAIAKH